MVDMEGFGRARVTVHKMLGYSIPTGYRREEPAKPARTA
jgi:hypothetical protein